MRPAIDTSYVEQRRKFDAMEARSALTPEQRAEVMSIVGDAVQKALAAVASMRQSDTEVLQRARVTQPRIGEA